MTRTLVPRLLVHEGEGTGKEGLAQDSRGAEPGLHQQQLRGWGCLHGVLTGSAPPLPARGLSMGSWENAAKDGGTGRRI